MGVVYTVVFTLSIDKSVVTLHPLCLATSTAGGVHAERSQRSIAHSKSIRQKRIRARAEAVR